MKIWWLLGCIVVGIAACGDGAGVGAPRVGTGGTAGGAGGGGQPECDCPLGQECADDGSCVSICGDVDACVFGGTAQCCSSDRVCDSGTCVSDCGAAVECNGACCGDSQTCFEGQCVAECADTSRLCGEDNELCCDAQEACIGEACVALGDECVLPEDCDFDELCEASLGRCIAREAVASCEFRPPIGEFAPTVSCRWTPPPAGDGATQEEIEIAAMAEVVMTPSVANLTDDNGDGVTDVRDMPDVVFVSFDRQADGCCTRRGVLRIVSGACNEDGTMDTIATLKGSDSGDWIGNSTGVALGNLHP
ncbi:MAG: hypothetical protein AAF436_15305, partial [Myxococcota bacterium]